MHRAVEDADESSDHTRSRTEAARLKHLEEITRLCVRAATKLFAQLRFWKFSGARGVSALLS